MFRWTAGTKARADLAARQHGAVGGSGRLLLARRPLLSGSHPTRYSPTPGREHGERTTSPCPPKLPEGDAVEANNRTTSVAGPRPCIEQARSPANSTEVLQPTASTQQATTESIAVTKSDVEPTEPAANSAPKTLFYPCNAATTTATMTPVSSAVPSPQARPQSVQPVAAVRTSAAPRPSSSSSSLVDADRLVRAMWAEERVRRKRRAHRQGARDTQKHHYHGRRFAPVAVSAVSPSSSHQVPGHKHRKTNRGDARRWNSSQHSQPNRILSTNGGARYSTDEDDFSDSEDEEEGDTYSRLLRERQRAEEHAREQRARAVEVHLSTSIPTRRPAPVLQEHHHRCLRSSKREKKNAVVQSKKNPSSAPTVSVDCVSVQLPLRAGAKRQTLATPSGTPASSTAFHTTACKIDICKSKGASSSTAQWVPSGRPSGLSGGPLSESIGGTSDVAAATECDDGMFGSAGMIEVAADKPCSGWTAAEASQRQADSEAATARTDVPLFQDAAVWDAIEQPRFSVLSRSVAGDGAYLREPYASDATVVPSSSQNTAMLAASAGFVFEDQPLVWSASPEQPPASLSNAPPVGYHSPCRFSASEQPYLPASPWPPITAVAATSRNVTPRASHAPWETDAPPNALADFSWLPTAPLTRDRDGVSGSPDKHFDVHSNEVGRSLLMHPFDQLPPPSAECMGPAAAVADYGALPPWQAVAPLPSNTRTSVEYTSFPRPPSPRQRRQPPPNRPFFPPHATAQPLPLHDSSAALMSRGPERMPGRSGRGGRGEALRTLNGPTERCRRFWERCRQEQPALRQPGYPSLR